MKTTRRHELQTNQLADTLARGIEKVKPYSRAGLAVLVAVVVLLFAWGYTANQSGRREAAGWAEYFEAFNTPVPREALSDIVEQYPGTLVSQWSRLMLADMELDEGTNRLFVEKKDARDTLRRSIDKYRTVLAESRQPSMLARAKFGLARAHEALGTLTEAREEYQSLAEQWPDSPYASAALARAKDLDQAGTKGFYDWFAKYEPPRPLSKEPGVPGQRPDFLKDPLEGSSIKLPGSIDDQTPLPKFDLGETPPSTSEPSKTPEGAQPEAAPPTATETPAASPPADAPAQSATPEPGTEPAPQPK